MLKQNVVFIIVFMCSGCKDRVSIGGVILDRESRKPVANVYISQRDIMKNTLVGDLDSSDQDGHYYYRHPLSGQYRDRVFVTLYFFNSGVTIIRNIRNGTLDDTVLMPSLRH